MRRGFGGRRAPSRLGRRWTALGAVVCVVLTSCSAEFVRECNAVKLTIAPAVTRMDETPVPHDMPGLRAHVSQRVDDYKKLAERVDGLPIATPQLAEPLTDYARAARAYSAEAALYLQGLEQHSPEQIDVARARAAREHENLVSAARSLAAWCGPFGPG